MIYLKLFGSRHLMSVTFIEMRKPEILYENNRFNMYRNRCVPQIFGSRIQSHGNNIGDNFYLLFLKKLKDLKDAMPAEKLDR